MMGFGDGSGVNWTICKQFAPCSRQITTPTPHHSISTGRMIFLAPNQPTASKHRRHAMACNTALKILSQPQSTYPSLEPSSPAAAAAVHVRCRRVVVPVPASVVSSPSASEAALAVSFVPPGPTAAQHHMPPPAHASQLN